MGSSRCLSRVVYKPSFGGQFVYEASNPSNPNKIEYSRDGKEVWFEIDTGNFQAGQGTLEIKAFGEEAAQTNPGMNQPQYGQNQYGQNQNGQQPGNSLPLKLYPAAPVIEEIKARRGDKEIVLTGTGLEQIQYLTVNGKRATIVGNQTTSSVSPVNGGVTNSPYQPNPSQPGSLQNNPYQSNPSQSGSPQSNPYQPTSQPGLNQNSPYNPAPQTNPYPNQSSNPSQPQTLPNPYQVQPNSYSSGSVSDPAKRVSRPVYNLSYNQKLAVFDDPNARITSGNLTIEIGMEDNRIVQYQQRFTVGVARPMINADERNEIDGTFLDEPLVVVENDQVLVRPERKEAINRRKNGKNGDEQPSLLAGLQSYPVVLAEQAAMTLAVRNILTDYGFKRENISIETKIENATVNLNELPVVEFEVLDTNNLRVNFSFNPTVIKALSGRRLQFRIKDREKENLIAYDQTNFVRVPGIEAVKCTNEMNNHCS